MQEYSQSDLTRLFHLPASLLRSLAGAGYISATAPQGKTSYSFQDLLVLRMASALKGAKISSTKITAALGRIRATLPPGSVLTSMALAASGKGVAVREGGAEWEANSGQYALPLAAPVKSAKVASVSHALVKPAMAVAARHYLRGHALEETDVAGARAAYLDALNAHRDHLEARINLGRLLHLEGELKEAESLSSGKKFKCSPFF